MWMKILSLAAVFLVGAMFVRDLMRSRLKGASRVETLEPCPRCGAFRAPTALCACERHPTP